MKNKTKSAVLQCGSFASLCLLTLALSSAKGINQTAEVSLFNISKSEVKILVAQDSLPITKPEPIYTNVDTLPSFPGGTSAFGKFLAKNLNYPPAARNAGIQGRVYVSYVVEKDGTLSNIKVVRGVGGGCDEEAIRVLKLSPKWNPGIHNNKVVRVSYTMPIFFQIQDRREPINK